MDVIEKIQKILDDRLSIVGILSHHMRRPKVDSLLQSNAKINNNAYVVYRVVSNQSIYGNGRSILLRTNFDINYYYRNNDSYIDSISAKNRVQTIEDAFKSNGWLIVNAQSDLYDTDNDFRGINIEVSCLEVGNG